MHRWIETATMAIDFTITMGNIIEAVILVGGGLITIGMFRQTIVDLKGEVNKMQQSIAQIGSILTKLAVQGSRLDRLEGDVRELRHGRGFVIPAQPDEG